MIRTIARILGLPRLLSFEKRVSATDSLTHQIKQLCKGYYSKKDLMKLNMLTLLLCEAHGLNSEERKELRTKYYNSEMSKLCYNIEEAQKTQKYYILYGINCYIKNIVIDSETWYKVVDDQGNLLKSINHINF